MAGGLWGRAKLAYDRLVLHSSRPVFALFAGICAGVAAVAIDLDHVSMFFGHTDGRILHPWLLILAIIVGCYCLARLGRLLVGVVLRNTQRRFCPTCNKEVERLVNFCEFCGTRMPSLKNASEQGLVILSQEFEKAVRTGWKCSRDHTKIINLAKLPEEHRKNGVVITCYCPECGEAIDKIIT